MNAIELAEDDVDLRVDAVDTEAVAEE